jgi:transcriptional regulator with XRE-family HTH domain
MKQYPNKESKALGRLIKMAIKTSPHTLKAVCKTLGTVTEQTLHNWINGNSVPDALQLKELARITGKALDYFYGESEISPTLLKAITRIVKGQAAKN